MEIMEAGLEEWYGSYHAIHACVTGSANGQVADDISHI